jgi:phage shock protein PspC (stress-responsive transcriptional regulator)
MWGLGILLYLAAIVIVPLNPNLSEKKTKDRIDRRSMWGIILIVLGLLFLLGHYGCRLLPWHIWFGFGLLWPLGFIILGLMLIFKPYKVTSTNADSSQIPRLYRIYEGRILLGIAGGTAEYFNLDYSLVRLLWILFALLSGGLGILVYLFMYFIIPEKSFKITKQETQDDSQK